MSTSGRQIYARAFGQVDETRFRVDFEYIPIVYVSNGTMSGGSAHLDMTGKTESELNAMVQQAIIDVANADLVGIDSFVLSDVRGGRI